MVPRVDAPQNVPVATADEGSEILTPLSVAARAAATGSLVSDSLDVPIHTGGSLTGLIPRWYDPRREGLPIVCASRRLRSRRLAAHDAVPPEPCARLLTLQAVVGATSVPSARADGEQ